MTEGFRTVFKEDIGTTVSELVYRTTIKLPGECVEESNPKTNEHEFVQQLRTHFHSIRPVHTSNHSKQSPFVFKDLQTCSHVLVRVDQFEVLFRNHILDLTWSRKDLPKILFWILEAKVKPSQSIA